MPREFAIGVFLLFSFSGSSYRSFSYDERLVIPLAQTKSRYMHTCSQVTSSPWTSPVLDVIPRVPCERTCLPQTQWASDQLNGRGVLQSHEPELMRRNVVVIPLLFSGACRLLVLGVRVVWHSTHKKTEGTGESAVAFFLRVFSYPANKIITPSPASPSTLLNFYAFPKTTLSPK